MGFLSLIPQGVRYFSRRACVATTLVLTTSIPTAHADMAQPDRPWNNCNDADAGYPGFSALTDFQKRHLFAKLYVTYGETFHQQISGTAAASKRQIDRLALNNVQTSTHDLRVYFAHWGLNVDQNELDGSATPIEYQEGTTNETITTP